MKIDLSVRTIPITVSREQAAKNIGKTATVIDKAIKQDVIDYGKIGRNIYVVVNEKWVEFLKKHHR